MLVTFEGGDGAGKSTLMQKLYAHLTQQGKSVIKTHAPGATPIGEWIRQKLLAHTETPLSHRTELFLFLADRAQHVDDILLPALKAKTIVLCDRFNDSTLAYQGTVRGFDPTWIQQLTSFASSGITPNLTFYIDIDPKEGLSRIKGPKDRIESETMTFHQKVRATYLQIARQEPNRFHILDGTRSPDENFQVILKFFS